ncbi:MAG: sulfotransferase domain-containing protein [Chloroflexota bacterium]|nr:sulfotransferase domain-containing protein [Chloroflexota bacterium]
MTSARKALDPDGIAAVPAGWEARPPDFVGVGTARSGTTWWDELIHAHPDVYRAPGVPKEVHFFDRFWDGSWADAEIPHYHASFARPAGGLAGEWTPGYMVDFWVPPLLRRAVPEARLLVLLRDPIERFRSGLTLTENRLTLSWTPRAAANGGFQRGCYADQLERLWAVFPKAQVLVLQYERCVADPRGELRRTFEFLGLDPTPADALTAADRRVNATRVSKASLTEAQRAAMARASAPEVERLGSLVPDLDLSLWGSYADGGGHAT